MLWNRLMWFWTRALVKLRQSVGMPNKMLARAERPESLASPNSCGLVLARRTAHLTELEGVCLIVCPHRGDLSMLLFPL
jgi:hypothetical protein